MSGRITDSLGRLAIGTLLRLRTGAVPGRRHSIASLFAGIAVADVASQRESEETIGRLCGQF